jgi:CHAD domain-containing protein
MNLMPLYQQQSRMVFEKLSREVAKLAKNPVPENVHKFRIYSRRVETVIDDLVAQPRRNQRKLLKLLGRLRKKAGRVRDLDVQISALRTLRIPQEPARKSQLMRSLVEERARRERKLPRLFNASTVEELRKRVKRAGRSLEISPEASPVALAIHKIAALEADQASVTEKTLHQYRIAGKRARYLAELGEKTAEAVRVIKQLKRLQDTLGDWHDWLQLTASAEELFGGTQQSAIVSALRNITRAKFRHGVNELAELRASLMAPKAVEEPSAPAPKPSARAAAEARAAVA